MWKNDPKCICGSLSKILSITFLTVHCIWTKNNFFSSLNNSDKLLKFFFLMTAMANITPKYLKKSSIIHKTNQTILRCKSASLSSCLFDLVYLHLIFFYYLENILKYWMDILYLMCMLCFQSHVERYARLLLPVVSTYNMFNEGLVNSF